MTQYVTTAEGLAVPDSLGSRFARFSRAILRYLTFTTPEREIALEHHYGADVWTHREMDQLRRTECLCRLCERCRPGQPDHCGTAAAVFRICQDRDMAFSTTRCPHFSPLPAGVTPTWFKSR